MVDAPLISALVICQDEADRIERCLDALGFCDEIIVVDSGSTDGTLEILKTRDVTVIERAMTSFAEQKDFAREQARNTWVLNVDADEVVSPDLASEMVDAVGRAPQEVAAFSMPFRNYFGDRWVRRCGYSPDRHIRLGRKDRISYDPDRSVHEVLRIDGEVQPLTGAIDHYSFRSVSHFSEKSARYAEMFAQDAARAGRTSGVLSLSIRPGWRFFRAYVLQGGFLEGTLGLIIAGLQAREVFLKYARLWELTRAPRAPTADES